MRKLLDRTNEAAPPDPEYSYTVYWTKTVREWDHARRASALETVEQLINQPDFTPTAFERKYQDSTIDASSHSGESILALRKVLLAFEEHSPSESDSSASDGV